MTVLAFAPGILAGGSGYLVASVYTDIRIVALSIGMISAFAAMLALIYGIRWKIAYEVERKAREGEQALAQSLEDRVRTIAHERDEVAVKLDEACDALRESDRTIARLEALPNLERVLELMHTTFERIMERVEELHQENRLDTAQRSEEAEERTTRIIEEIRRAAK